MLTDHSYFRQICETKLFHKCALLYENPTQIEDLIVARKKKKKKERERVGGGGEGGGAGAAKRLVWTEPAWCAGKGNGRERKGAVFPRPSAETKQPFYIRIQCRSISIRILRVRSIVICSIVQNMSSHLIHTNTSMCIKCHVHWHLVVY